MSQHLQNTINDLLERITAASREAEILLQRINARRMEALARRAVVETIATGVQLPTPNEEGNNPGPHIVLAVRHIQVPSHYLSRR
ncbi:hypothetical protein BT96DRAFT_920281 [Gymnopus androsaceus JB14]|uniref:Uncharacterized protein n=1 Tax=Gymnopus androsaceus JB14 TaxID=1447944 RepID=A0A6A4HQ94_9AGAR|nr:hypothetical protein BT96DRAFT_920281 [Gymnopus androsaceus JB14]